MDSLDSSETCRLILIIKAYVEFMEAHWGSHPGLMKADFKCAESCPVHYGTVE